MINAEKYKDEILAIVNDSDYFAIDIDNTSVVRPCGGLECKNCVFNNNDYNDCNFLRMNWLLSEYKESPVKLTRLEYLLLKLFYKKDYKYLTRGVGGYLYAHKGNNPPQKNGGMWFNCETYITFNVINDLFQFVQWEDEEPKSIKKLLNNCEVIDNEDN